MGCESVLHDRICTSHINRSFEGIGTSGYRVSFPSVTPSLSLVDCEVTLGLRRGLTLFSACSPDTQVVKDHVPQRRHDHR